MKAARSFTHGAEGAEVGEVHRYAVGDEVPDDVVEALGDQGNNLILELAAKANPEILSREQLYELAGLAPEGGSESVPEEFNEETFREGFAEFSTKGDLIEWAETALGISGLDPSWTRPEIEDSIVAAYTEEDTEE